MALFIHKFINNCAIEWKLEYRRQSLLDKIKSAIKTFHSPAFLRRFVSSASWSATSIIRERNYRESIIRKELTWETWRRGENDDGAATKVHRTMKIPWSRFFYWSMCTSIMKIWQQTSYHPTRGRSSIRVLDTCFMLDLLQRDSSAG